jgi:uncharacterized protein YndB with AHSA1/START domain
MADQGTTAPPALELKRTYAAAPEKVFAAWADPARMSQWLKPSAEASVEVEADVRIGGRYRLRIVLPDGAEHISYGEYQEVAPPERLVFTWSWESGMAAGTLVTVSLRPVEGGTELTLRHERLETEELRQSHAMGWGGCLELLEGYLAA